MELKAKILMSLLACVLFSVGMYFFKTVIREWTSGVAESAYLTYHASREPIGFAFAIVLKCGLGIGCILASLLMFAVCWL